MTEAEDAPKGAVYVCNLAELTRHAKVLRPSHLVSLVPAYEQPETPPPVVQDRHHRVILDDIVEPRENHIYPDGVHVEPLVAFLESWEPQEPILIHCFAGISRSMAAAMILLSMRSGRSELEVAEYIRFAAPHAQPNRRIVALADEVLGRKGRLLAARDAMTPRVPLMAGPLTKLSLGLDEF